MKTLFKVLNLLALLGATAWIVSNFDWEPIVTFLTLLSSFIYLEFKKDSTDKHDADKKLFDKFNEALPYYNVSYVAVTSLKSPFINNKMDPFFDFDSSWNDVHHTFLNTKLEKKKQKLYRSISLFTSLLAEHTVTHNNPRLQWIPADWEQRNRDEYNKACNDISKSQDEVVKDYNDFVRYAKHLLKV